MSDINKAVARLGAVAKDPVAGPGGFTAIVGVYDLRALLDNHARLQADEDRLDWLEGFVRRAYVYGVSFDFARSCEGEPGGFRFMARHRLDARQPTLRAAVDAAKAVQS